MRGCTSREPTLVGKPSPLMLDYLCSEFGLERHRVCMVGDRTKTRKSNKLAPCLTMSQRPSERLSKLFRASILS